MITPAYCQTMAQYNAWQNNGLCEIVEKIDEDVLRFDRGAFFGSILGTLNHLLWGDLIWMARFDSGVSPDSVISKSVDLTPTSSEWAIERLNTDNRIQMWADNLQNTDLMGDLSWFSGSLKADVTRPLATCITHFFNHQTHHRGQIHAMLTAAGANPQATNLVFMPEA
jgi:uncharacterized damage-inducible protein DinB